MSGGNGHCDEDLLKAFLDDRTSFTAVLLKDLRVSTLLQSKRYDLNSERHVDVCFILLNMASSRSISIISIITPPGRRRSATTTSELLANVGRSGEGALSRVRGLRRLQPLQRGVRGIKSQVGGVGWL